MKRMNCDLQLEASYDFTCGLAYWPIASSQKIYCWVGGAGGMRVGGFHSQLGLLVLGCVPAINSFPALRPFATPAQTMIQGWNSKGQLGDGTTTDKNYPVLVQGESTLGMGRRCPGDTSGYRTTAGTGCTACVGLIDTAM